MKKSEYERRVAEDLKRWLLGPNEGPKALEPDGSDSRVVVEEVRLESVPDGEAHVVVLYRDPTRPWCLFGWRVEAFCAEDDVQIRTSILEANFVEHVIGTPYGLPKDCAPEGITWTDRTQG